jgi:hypothetical protein
MTHLQENIQASFERRCSDLLDTMVEQARIDRDKGREWMRRGDYGLLQRV